MTYSFCSILTVAHVSRGLEKVLDALEADRAASKQMTPRRTSSEKEADVRRVLMREKRAAAWRALQPAEKDVLTVFTAVCKVSQEACWGVICLKLPDHVPTMPTELAAA